MNKKELVEKINKDYRVLRSYSIGELKSKVYTDKEIEEKRQYFLSKIPPKDSNISLNRWYYEIKRVFDLSNDFRKSPDMWFYHLETFFD